MQGTYILMMNVINGMVTFFIAAFAVYAFHLRRLLKQKNRILVSQATDVSPTEFRQQSR